MLYIIRRYWGQFVAAIILMSVGLIHINYIHPHIAKLLTSIQNNNITILQCIIILAWFLTIQLLNYIAIKILAVSLSKINTEIQSLLFNRSLSINEFNNDEEGKHALKIATTANSLTHFLEILYLFLTPFIIEVLITLYKLFITARYSFYIFLVWILGYTILNIFLAKYLEKNNLKLLEERCNTANYYIDIFKNILITRLFRLKNKNINNLQSYLTSERKYYISSLTGIGLTRVIIGMYNICFLVVFILVLSNSHLPTSMIMTFATIGISTLTNLWKMLHHITQLFHLYGEFSNINNYQLSKSIGSLALDNITEVRIENLSYNYHNHEIFNNMSFCIDKPGCIKIEGTSGDGKSTLFKCITRLVSVPNNTIYFNNIDINDITEKNLRNIISYLPQKNLIFNDTIKENLISNLSDNQLKNECQQYNLNVNLSRMAGLNNLSGGEAKRLCFIRTKLSVKPGNIIIFDEPFENLDYQNIYIIKQTIELLSKDHIIFFTDHTNILKPDYSITLFK